MAEVHPDVRPRDGKRALCPALSRRSWQLCLLRGGDELVQARVHATAIVDEQEGLDLFQGCCRVV